MFYRLIIGLLLIVAIVASVDTKSIKQHIDGVKIAQEYKNSSKILGIGFEEINGKLKVQDVLTNTPADKSGIEVGDVLVEIDGQTMTRVEAIKAYLDGIKQNKKIDLTFIKPDNQIIEVQLLPQIINPLEQISSK